MLSKSSWWQSLNVKNINRTFAVVVFVLVFLFTFFITSELKEHWVILVSVFAGLIALAIACWVVLVILISKREKMKDTNRQKIEKAIKKLEEQNDSNK